MIFQIGHRYFRFINFSNACSSSSDEYYDGCDERMTKYPHRLDENVSRETFLTNHTSKTA